jgi:phage/plasmid-like protein (TIGR03299 family)
MLKAAGLDWTVAKRELFYAPADGGNASIKVPGKYGLVRATDNRLLTIVGSTYKPVQNDEAMDFFKKFVTAGKMSMETAGSLHGGQYIWALARLGSDFKLGKGDEVRGYLLLSQPHVFGKAMVIQFTPIRVVCWNTLTFALGGDLKGKPGSFRMPHSIAFNDVVKQKAEIALGLATEQMDEFKQAAQLLSKKKADPKDVEEFFCEVLKFDPKVADKKKTRSKKKADAVIEPRMLPRLRAALTHAPGSQLPTAIGTWWGAANAVTYVVDHELGRDQSAALRTAWLGAKAGLKRRAIKLAIDRAK